MYLNCPMGVPVVGDDTVVGACGIDVDVGGGIGGGGADRAAA
jgi:hypothetical protein